MPTAYMQRPTPKLRCDEGAGTYTVGCEESLEWLPGLLVYLLYVCTAYLYRQVLRWKSLAFPPGWLSDMQLVCPP